MSWSNLLLSAVAGMEPSAFSSPHPPATSKLTAEKIVPNETAINSRFYTVKHTIGQIPVSSKQFESIWKIRQQGPSDGSLIPRQFAKASKAAVPV